MQLQLLILSLLGTFHASPLTHPVSQPSTLTLLAQNLMSPIYNGANGLLPAPYWPWISASRFTTMIHYFHATNDTTYNNDTATSLLSQAGPNSDFSGPQIPGNDDQLWFGIACITAAEYEMPGAPTEKWFNLSRNVFETVIGRWQNGTGCNAGLGWQIDPNAANGGYHYKNSITNGLAFQLAARLGKMTREDGYVKWAERLWQFEREVGLIDENSYQVFDGVRSPECGPVNREERWSYNSGVWLYGVAVMLDLQRNSTSNGGSSSYGASSGSVDWLLHLHGFVSAAKSDFTRDSVLYERLCEDAAKCNTDQTTFKAYLARWLGLTAELIPETIDEILPVLEASAKAVEGSVKASPEKNAVGLKLTGKLGFDGITGAGQQMFGIEVLGALRVLGDGRNASKITGESDARRR